MDAAIEILKWIAFIAILCGMIWILFRNSLRLLGTAFCDLAGLILIPIVAAGEAIRLSCRRSRKKDETAPRIGKGGDAPRLGKRRKR